MTLTRNRAVAAVVGLVLLGSAAGCGSGERASWGSPSSSARPASPSPSLSAVASPSVASRSAPVNADLSLRLVKVAGHPSCTIYMFPSATIPSEIGLPHAVVAFAVVGLPNADGATVALTSPPDGTNTGVVAKFNADGTLRAGDYVALGTPKVEYYAFPVNLRRLYNRTVSFTLTVDPDNVVNEPNERNNVLKVRLTVRGVVGPPKLTKGYPSGARNRCAKVS